MNYKHLKLFKKTESIMVPLKMPNDKNICMVLFGENDDSISIVKASGIKKSWIKWFFVPNTKPPVRTYMDGKYRMKIVSETGLRPVKGNFEDIDAISNRNFYIDASCYIDSLMDKFNFQRFNQKRPYGFFNRHIENVNHVDSESFEKCLLYSVNMDKPFDKNIFKRRIFTILYRLKQSENEKNNYESFPFDKILMMVHGENIGRYYVLLFDKNMGVRNRFNRVRSYIMKLVPGMQINDDNVETDETDNNVDSNVKPNINMDKINISKLLKGIDVDEY